MLKSISKYKLILFLIGVGLYLNTVSFDYALDDKLVITANQITKKGFAGIPLHFTHDAMDGFWAEQYNVPIEEFEGNNLVSGGRYRPLTLATHALEYSLFKESPGISHFINALLYGFLCLLLYKLLMLLFPQKESWYAIPFLVVLLYAVHPLHVEVVANIKGRDELLSFLFAAWALVISIPAIETNNLKNQWIGGFLFGLSLLAKETTLPFLVILPLIIYYKQHKLKEVFKSALPFAGVTVVYLALRMSVLGNPDLQPPNELMNNPFLEATVGQKWGVILLTFFAYLKLMVLPHPLTHDYYPFHLPFTSAEMHYPELSHWAALLGLVCGIVLIILAIQGLLKRDVKTLGIWIFFGTLALVLNVLFPVGVFMNERFMFIPSLGLSILVVAALAERIKAQKLAYGIVGIAFVFAGLTINRNYAWESDESLALTDVETSVGSAKAHMAAGDAYLSKARKTNLNAEKNTYLTESFKHLNASLKIYPTYFPPLDLLANVYFESGNYKASAEFYAKCYQRKPEKQNFLTNIVIVGNRLVSEKRYQEALEVYKIAIQENPYYISALSKAAEIEARYLNNPNGALIHLKAANNAEPSNADILQRLGIVYAMIGDFTNAILYLEKSLAIDPTNKITMNNLGITYLQAGQTQKGEQLMKQAKQE